VNYQPKNQNIVITPLARIFARGAGDREKLWQLAKRAQLNEADYDQLLDLWIEKGGDIWLKHGDAEGRNWRKGVAHRLSNGSKNGRWRQLILDNLKRSTSEEEQSVKDLLDEARSDPVRFLNLLCGEPPLYILNEIESWWREGRKFENQKDRVIGNRELSAVEKQLRKTESMLEKMGGLPKNLATHLNKLRYEIGSAAIAVSHARLKKGEHKLTPIPFAARCLFKICTSALQNRHGVDCPGEAYHKALIPAITAILLAAFQRDFSGENHVRSVNNHLRKQHAESTLGFRYLDL